MSRLDDATQRLQSAIERLDRAVVARSARDAAQAEGGQDDELRAALEGAKRENARLQATASEASERLDAAILRLRAVLEDRGD